MNERNLSRKLATSVVDALKAHGHILVVKGGATALARELEELMAPSLAPIAPRLEPRALVGGEVTSTFGDESIDETVEEMVARMTRALMDSDHVEDVFAEDNVIRRDIFRAVRDGLLQPAVALGAEDEEEETAVKVRLDMLGYVAATVSKRADVNTLRNALERAAAMAQASFAAYSADAREATFRLEGDGPDERLELEEAVADELTDLVEQGLVDLPTIERRVDTPRPISPADQRAVRRRVEALAEATLRSGGCAASWEFSDASTIRVTFTPLSDKDAREVDKLLAAFSRELAGALSEAKATAGPRSSKTPAAAADREAAGSKPRAGGASPTSSRGKAVREIEPVIALPSFEDEEELEVIQVVPPSKRARAASSGGKAAPASARDGAPASAKPRSRKAAEPEEVPSSGKSRAASAASTRATTRTAAPSRTTKRAAPKRAAPKRAAAAEPSAPKRAAASKSARKPSAAVKAPASRRAAAPAAKARKAPAKKR